MSAVHDLARLVTAREAVAFAGRARAGNENDDEDG